MKIAIASLGKTTDSEISEKAGRAPYYLVFEDKKLLETIKNPFVGGGGAGFGVAKMLADKDVKEVVAGKFGGNIISAFEERDVKIKEGSGSVMDFVDKM